MVRFNLRRGVTEDLDEYYKLREDCEDVLISRFRPKKGKRLSVRRWREAFGPEGELKMDKVLPRVEAGGVHPSVRGEVWEILLGCFSPNNTAEERAALRKSRREQYAILKAECRAMDSVIGSGVVVTVPRIMENEDFVCDHIGKSSIKEESSEKRHEIPPAATLQRSADESGKGFSAFPNKEGGINMESQLTSTSEKKTPEIRPMDKKVMKWKLLLHQIGLDVVRTDRMLQFYEGPKNLAKLWDVLAVYAWFDEDVGYCQGMSDLCSAMVVLFEDEADAFWCFERLMHRVRENFRCDGPSLGVLKQLAVLRSVMEVVDFKLHKHLEALGGGTYIFALRMLMVLFRREFSFSDTLYLWEMLWACEFGLQTDVSLAEKNYPFNFKLVTLESRNEAVPRKERACINNGKFVKRTIKYGSTKLDKGTPLAVFCVAAILERNQKKLLKGTEGLDEVLKFMKAIFLSIWQSSTRVFLNMVLVIFNQSEIPFWWSSLSMLSTVTIDLHNRRWLPFLASYILGVKLDTLERVAKQSAQIF